MWLVFIENEFGVEGSFISDTLQFLRELKKVNKGIKITIASVNPELSH